MVNLIKSSYQREHKVLSLKLSQASKAGVNGHNSEEFNKKSKRLEWLTERINSIK